jgi:L-rhamnose isomerase
VIGIRNLEKALLSALLLPNEELRLYQDKSDFTKMLAVSEECKTLPFGAVWEEYCNRCGVPAGREWLDTVDKYEKEVLSKR